jgi:hypothetical protein
VIASEETSLLPHTVTLSGLAPGLYDLYAYAGYYPETFSAGAGSATASGAGYLVTDPALWVAGNQYALLAAVVVGGSGLLALTVTPADGGDFGAFATIAGLQLTPSAVPLPASLPLFLTGLVSLIAWFRKPRRREMTNSSDRTYALS